MVTPSQQVFNFGTRQLSFSFSGGLPPQKKKPCDPYCNDTNFTILIDRLDQGDTQGRSQPHSPGWARPSSTFLIFPQILIIFFLFFLKLFLFYSSFWPYGWASRPGKALAMPLGLHLDLNNPWSVHFHVVQIFTNIVGKIGEWEAPGKFWCWKGNFQKFCLFVHKNTLQIVRKLASFLENKQFFLLCPLKKQTNKQKQKL